MATPIHLRNERKLILIKLVHTAIWIFFSVVIFYLLYAALTDRIDTWFWVAAALVGLEILVLLLFRMSCPLTVMARRYSSSTRANFDIYLPEWLARYNKEIYSAVLVIVVLMLLIH